MTTWREEIEARAKAWDEARSKNPALGPSTVLKSREKLTGIATEESGGWWIELTMDYGEPITQPAKKAKAFVAKGALLMDDAGTIDIVKGIVEDLLSEFGIFEIEDEHVYPLMALVTPVRAALRRVGWIPDVDEPIRMAKLV